MCSSWSRLPCHSAMQNAVPCNILPGVWISGWTDRYSWCKFCLISFHWLLTTCIEVPSVVSYLYLWAVRLCLNTTQQCEVLWPSLVSHFPHVILECAFQLYSLLGSIHKVCIPHLGRTGLVQWRYHVSKCHSCCIFLMSYFRSCLNQQLIWLIWLAFISSCLK